MSSVSISLITVCYNAAETIEKCILSVIAQKYPKLQYIVIDAKSTDNTLQIINKYRDYINIFISEPDNGLYDAMNKGIKHASGTIIGTLNADDYFAADNILEIVGNAFRTSDSNIVYGDIDYVDNKENVIRKWRSGEYRPGKFNYGWMPPHPSFYALRSCFINYGDYCLQYGTATDYELMLRFIHVHKLSIYYLDVVMVKMRIGGLSNKRLLNRVSAWKNDYKAMCANGLKFPYFSIILKPFRKVFQFLP